jgi:hypothetical protein
MSHKVDDVGIVIVIGAFRKAIPKPRQLLPMSDKQVLVALDMDQRESVLQNFCAIARPKVSISDALAHT